MAHGPKGLLVLFSVLLYESNSNGFGDALKYHLARLVFSVHMTCGFRMGSCFVQAALFSAGQRVILDSAQTGQKFVLLLRRLTARMQEYECINTEIRF